MQLTPGNVQELNHTSIRPERRDVHRKRGYMTPVADSAQSKRTALAEQRCPTKRGDIRLQYLLLGQGVKFWCFESVSWTTPRLIDLKDKRATLNMPFWLSVQEALGCRPSVPQSQGVPVPLRTLSYFVSHFQDQGLGSG